MDDAAIYQASARNSKGIVSCSGVLEVGTMSEYKIHQRFFAKLKQKAELKRRELEQSYCQEKDNILKEQLSSSQNNIRWTDGLVHSSSVQDGEDNEAREGELIEEQPENLNEEWNRFSVNVHRYMMRSDRSQENDSQHMSLDVGQKNSNQQLIYRSEKAEIGGSTPSIKEKLSRNNITVSNGFDEAFTTHSRQGTGEGKDTHEGMSLAKILEESLQLKFSEEHQNTALQSQELTSTKDNTTEEGERENDVDTKREKINVEGRHQECKSCWEEEQNRSLKEEQENIRQHEPEHRAVVASEAKTPVCIEPLYRHKSALSSVFHSLKDIFFGKSKKSPEITDSTKKVSEINAEKEILTVSTEAHFHHPQPQICDTSGICGTIPDQLAPVAIDQQNQIGTLHTPLFQDSPSVHNKSKMENLNLDDQIHEFTTNYIKDVSEASKIHSGSVEEERIAGPEALQKNTLTIHKVSLFLLLLVIIISVHYRYTFPHTSPVKYC